MRENLADNVTRGVLAEYIVASALGVNEGVRSAWDAYDLRTSSGLRVEVKSSAYLQQWRQRKLSPVQFEVGPKRGWDGETGTMAKDAAWQSDIYVLCLLKHREKATLNPLDLDQWEAYEVPTELLRERCGTRLKIKIRLGVLATLNIAPVGFDGLKARVEAVGASADVRKGELTA